MSKIIVIGGGASGLTAAINASKNGNKVILLESNSTCGKKILKTGNGRCNYFNDDFSINHYSSNNLDILKEIITSNSKERVLSFFSKLGIFPRVQGGYYYPNSNQAITVREALLTECNLKGVEICCNTCVEDIIYSNNRFIIKTNVSTITCDKVIVSVGSKANVSKNGCEKIIQILKKFNHNTVPILPALMPLKCVGNYFNDWSGVRSLVSVTAFVENKPIKTSQGEIQLTSYGLSGICVFQISGCVIRALYQKKPVFISINFLPNTMCDTIPSTIEFLSKRNNDLKNRTVLQLLDGIFNYHLTNLFLKLSHISSKETWNDLSLNTKRVLAGYICSFQVEVDSKNNNDFAVAQVTSGGIPLCEINIHTMESIYQKNLYFTGEILDVDGECGGYNLAFAWLSGIIAGNSSSK